MISYFLVFCIQTSDEDPLITQELVDSINNDPRSSFKAALYPKFANMKIKEAKKFLSPVRKAPEAHGSARPVGFSERSFYNSDKRYFSGIQKEIICGAVSATFDFSDVLQAQKKPANQFECNAGDTPRTRYWVQYPLTTVNGKNVAQVPFNVYDNSKFCSSWATAVTSAMTTTLTRWTNVLKNLSVQFILDCDILGDPCVERPPLSAYEQFWRRYIPTVGEWRYEENPTTAASRQLTQKMCDFYKACYPGMQCTQRELVLTGVCDSGAQQYGACPIYFLYNWRWIKSHLAEVGAVTSSILARAALFSYASGVYSSFGGYSTTYVSGPSATDTDATFGSAILGMLDVTIIGWGQNKVNLTSDLSENSLMRKRWWYVIPHLGIDWGLTCKAIFDTMGATGPPTDLIDRMVPQDNPQVQIFNTKTDGTLYTTTDTTNRKKLDDIEFNFGGSTSTPGVQRTCALTTLTTHGEVTTGVMMFNRRFDDSNIESQAVGAVPFNFIPRPWRTPEPTWSSYTTPPSDP